MRGPPSKIALLPILNEAPFTGLGGPFQEVEVQACIPPYFTLDTGRLHKRPIVAVPKENAAAIASTSAASPSGRPLKSVSAHSETVHTSYIVTGAQSPVTIATLGDTGRLPAGDGSYYRLTMANDGEAQGSQSTVSLAGSLGPVIAGDNKTTLGKNMRTKAKLYHMESPSSKIIDVISYRRVPLVQNVQYSLSRFFYGLQTKMRAIKKASKR